MVGANTGKKAFTVVELFRYTLNQSFSLIVFEQRWAGGCEKTPSNQAIPKTRFLKGRSSRAACRAHQRLVEIRKRDDRVAAQLEAVSAQPRRLSGYRLP